MITTKLSTNCAFLVVNSNKILKYKLLILTMTLKIVYLDITNNLYSDYHVQHIGNKMFVY